MNSNSDIKIKRQYKYLKKLLSDDYEITSEEFSFIINSLEIQSLLDNFHKLTHIGIGILDMKGKVHVHTEWQDICTKFHRVNPQSCRNCIDSDIFLTKEIKEGKYLMYKCKNNMRSLATPIYFGEKRIGTLYFGQFFFKDEKIDKKIFIKQAEKYGFDKKEYLKALEAVPRLSKEKVGNAIHFFTKFADIISNLNYTNVKLNLANQERKIAEVELKKSEELFKAVVHHSPIGIAITDEMGNLIEFNDSMANILGYSRSELKSMNFEEFTHKEDLEKEWRLIKEMISGRRKDYRIRKRYIHKDGHYIWVDVISSLVFVKEGYPTFGFGFIQDITEDIKAEKELKEERDRSEFYKDLLAHDMGNILNNIKSSIDLIRIQKEEKLNSINTSEMLNIVENQIMRGTSLISNVRKLSKFEKLSSKTVEINLQDILNKAIIEIKGIYLSKKVEISTKIPKQPIFIKAGELLFDVFSNIMLNSIIHNNREPILISIKISELKENNRNYVKIEFQDNAFGIEDYRKKNIFNRSQIKDKNTGGMGIGLSLVKNIIQSYNGRIWVENRIENDFTQGSNFNILLEKS